MNNSILQLRTIEILRCAGGIDLSDLMKSIERHAMGDWGEMDCEGIHANFVALRKGGPVSSIFIDRNGSRFQVTTNGARTKTFVMRKP
jgi:hypothetical protein